MKNKIIGVLGGMGPQASAEFYRLLIEGAKHRYGAHNNDEYPEVLLDSVPVPDFLSDLDKMEEAAAILEKRVRKLAQFGATYITMSCNTACILSDRLQNQTSVPYISIIDEVIKAVSKDHKRVLLLASPTSLRLGLYQLALSRSGLPYEVPPQIHHTELEYIIREVIDGGDRSVLTKKLVRLTEKLLAEFTCDAVLLGCTELPLVFPRNYRIPVYSSLSILAESVLKLYYKEVI